MLKRFFNQCRQNQIFTQELEQMCQNFQNLPMLERIITNYIDHLHHQEQIQEQEQANQLPIQNALPQNGFGITNISVSTEMNIINNQDEAWQRRRYVLDTSRNNRHIRNAYYINIHITDQGNIDPLEYFAQYRQNGN